MILLLAFVCVVHSCGFLAPMMSGCGGGCAPPPPFCGCGRKKRSIAKPVFYGIVGKDDDVLCNHPELKKLIRDNMHQEMENSSKALQTALEQKNAQRYVVVCTETSFVYSIRPDLIYCGAKNHNHYCHIFAI
ncbi:unnamed protein product [Caenorhabditis bovis]|uniref:Ground-like domain-containing protein n=1 Tax=Caenorhabditis bovis TaxID=2654633 RepID=A0A8S1E083_9PELO|nr:unnamed protein product [Caenorhabditis bovis]